MEYFRFFLFFSPSSFSRCRVSSVQEDRLPMVIFGSMLGTVKAFPPVSGVVASHQVLAVHYTNDSSITDTFL